MHEFGVLDGDDERHHAALRRAEKAHIPQSQRAHGLGRVPRGVVHGVDRRERRAAVEEIDGKFLRHGGVRFRDGVGGVHDRVDAEPGENDERARTGAEAEILHFKGCGFHRFNGNGHFVPFLLYHRFIISSLAEQDKEKRARERKQIFIECGV